MYHIQICNYFRLEPNMLEVDDRETWVRRRLDVR